MNSIHTDPARPMQESFFNAVSEFAQTGNPLALKKIDKNTVSRDKVNGNVLAERIQNFYIDRGDGKSFLQTKSVEDLTRFRSGLVKAIAQDLGSRDQFARIFDLVNNVGNQKVSQESTATSSSQAQQSRVSPQAKPTRTSRAKGQDSSVKPERQKRTTTKKKEQAVAASAARVNVAQPQAMTRQQEVTSLIRWAEGEASATGRTLSERDRKVITMMANSQTPEQFQLWVKQVILIVSHKEK